MLGRVGEPGILYFFDRVLPLVDRTIALLAKEKFRADPIGGDRYSRMTSVISSAYKRHGTIIEAAIRERLKDNENFEVWGDHVFCVSSAANILSGRVDDCIGATLNYGEIGPDASDRSDRVR